MVIVHSYVSLPEGTCNDPISTMILDMIWTCNWNIGKIISISLPKKQYGLIWYIYIYIIQLDDMTYSSNIHPISNIIQYHSITSPEIWAIHSRKNADLSRVFLGFPMVDFTIQRMVPDCSHRNDQPTKLLRCFRRVAGQVVLLWIPAMFRWRTLFTAPFLNLQTLLFLCRHAFLLDPFVANWIGYWNHSRDMKHQPAFVWIIGRSRNCKCWTVFYGFPPTLPHRILTVPNASEPNRPNSRVATQRAGKAVPGHCRDSLNLGCIIACNLYDPIHLIIQYASIC